MSEEQGYLQRQLYGIGVFEDEIVLSDYTGTGERRYVVTQEQLMQFFRTEVTFRPFPGLIWMKQDGDRESYLITLPAQTRTILYQNQKAAKGKKKEELTALKIALPALAVKIGVDTTRRKISSVSMWGFAGKELKSDSVLYELPLPNLSGPSLCLGSNDFETNGRDVRQVAEKVIFDTPFNWHHDVVGIERLPFRQYHKKHRGRCPFKTLNKLGKGLDLLEARI